MQRWIGSMLALVWLATAATAALAQADAQQAYQEAKTAYEAGQSAQARDLAQKASETDPKNPEVFLLLGKAHYQLGELDEAITAWQKTLALAPEEPFAKRMLEVLQNKQLDVDLRIKLVEALIQEQLYRAAGSECVKLLSDTALSDEQRAHVKTLQAEVLVRTNAADQAQRVIRELLVLHPEQADPVQTTFLLGLAKLRTGGSSTVEGLAMLKQIVADHADTPAAVTAQYELLAYDLKQGPNTARADALARWATDHPDHAMVRAAQTALIDAYLAVTRQGPTPTADSKLSPSDQKALALAVELYKQSTPTSEAHKQTEKLLAHLDLQYAKRGARAAAIQGIETLLKAPLPRNSRLLALRALAANKSAVALADYQEAAEAGKLPATAPLDQLPGPLADVVAVYTTINQEYPTAGAWVDQAGLAEQVRKLAPAVPLPEEVTGLKSPDAWAVAIARPVIAANLDAAAVTAAVQVIQAVLNDYRQINQPAPRKLAVGLSTSLVADLAIDHTAHNGVVAAHAELLDAYAKYLFNENVKAGQADQNAELSDVQKKLLALLAKHVGHDVKYAPEAIKLLGTHLQPWLARGHWAVAEAAYAAIANALPAAEQRQAELAVVDLWISQVQREHARLAAAGFTVPRELDATLKKALLRCYELQAGLPADSAALAQVRERWQRIVNHYQSLEYFDVAEQAIQVKPEAAVEAADRYAAFQLVVLRETIARQELAQGLLQYGAREKIELGPKFKEVLTGWTTFITQQPTSPLAPQAVQRIWGIGQLFEQYEAFEVAATVYGDFAKAAAAVAVLTQAEPGTASTVQQAAYRVATALDAQARKVLAKATAERESGDPPPVQLSPEFKAAIAAYQGFIADHPKSPLVGDATGKIMSAAYEYAKIDAWAVAESVYADLLAAKLEIRRPERLKFAQGLCRLGQAMPDHARQILATLTSGGLRGSGERLDPATLAVNGTDFRGAIGGAIGAGGLTVDGAGTVATSRTRSAVPPPPAAPPGASSAPAGGPGDTATLQADIAQPNAYAERDVQLLAMINRQEANRASQVAQLRENLSYRYNAPVQQIEQQQGQQAAQQQIAQAPAAPVLSEAELARQQKALDAAYAIFQAIRKDYPRTLTAEQARGEILVMVGHWRTLSQWERAAALATTFLADNPTDRELPKLRLEVARDRLAWATKPIERQASKQAMLAEVSTRFDAARKELAKVVSDFPDERSYRQQAQWDIANSFLTQARVVAVFSPTLARGQFVRAAEELRQVAVDYPRHPQIGNIPQMLWNIATELEGRGYDDEAILVFNDLTIYDPLNGLAQQAALKIAQTYHHKLKRPLKAAEAYQELNYTRGGSDRSLQDAIFQIGSDLKGQKRWVEALHVLETFVDSFPKHPQAGQALTMVGQIHQANEAWQDAIAAYRRVIDEFENGQFVQEAKWAIAECTINLSKWSEASDAYREYVKAYPKDAKLAEANRRIEVLKDLARYQGLVDEKGQRKAFDAQYQIAEIVKEQLSNPVKAIIEYRKVVKNWPTSHLADDALYAVGTTYLELTETEKAREALLAVAEKYPASPLADDALYMVGKSYENEADRLATVTRAKSLAQAKDVAQKQAYQLAQTQRRIQDLARGAKISKLRSEGKGKAAALEEASKAANYGQFNVANVELFAQKAEQEVETLTATQMADRQDKINAALRKAVDAYTSASKVAGADKADEALLQMATIFDQRLKDPTAAMTTWLEIVRQFSGTAVAEDASWRIAEHYQRDGKYAEAIEAYKAFLRNYRRSPKAGDAQFAIAENYEHLDEWVNAMDSYTNYITNFPEGPLRKKAEEQINWIKTYRL